MVFITLATVSLISFMLILPETISQQQQQNGQQIPQSKQSQMDAVMGKFSQGWGMGGEKPKKKIIAKIGKNPKV